MKKDSIQNTEIQKKNLPIFYLFSKTELKYFQNLGRFKMLKEVTLTH